MEMNNDIFTPDLPIPEPVGFEDAPIPAPAEEEKPVETPPPRRRRKADASVLTIESGDEIAFMYTSKLLPGTRFTTPTARGVSFRHRWVVSSRPTAARRLLSWITTASASSFLSKK